MWRKVIREQVNELVARARLQRVVRAALPANRGRTLRAHLPPAKRACSVSREDFRVVRKSQQFLVKAVVQQRCQLLRCMASREVRPPDVAYKKGVTSKHLFRLAGLAEIRHQNANTLQRVAGG